MSTGINPYIPLPYMRERALTRWSDQKADKACHDQMLTLLIVEPDAAIRELLNDMFYYEGHQVIITDKIPSVEFICGARPDAAILNLPLIGPDSLFRLIMQLRTLDSIADLPILVTTTNNCLLDSLRLQFERMSCDVLLKPFDLHVLLSWVMALPAAARVR